MKKRLILLPIAGLLIYLLSSYATGPGAKGGYERTGASGAIGCFGSGCHAASATPAITVKVELYDATGTTLVSPVHYTPGTAYKLRLTGTNTGSTIQKKFGFQMSTVKTATTTANAGTMTAISGTHLGTYLSINIVEHSNPMSPATGTGGTGTTYVAEIPWTAPVAGTGSVSAMATLNAVTGDGASGTDDLWNNTALVIPEATAAAAPITGTLSVCVGATTALSDATPAGTWSSGATTIATVSSAGLVSGIAAGTAVITYNAGASGSAMATVTVLPTAPAAITGASVTCVSKTITLSDATTGGTWSSGTTTVATVTSSGTVAGVTVGTATISYTITNTCGTASATKVVSIHAAGTCAAGVTTGATITGTSLQVYPNPNRGAFTLTIASAEQTPAHVTITTITGEVVKEFDTDTNKATDISMNRPAGIYFISARTVSGIFVSKVLTQY